MLLGVNNHSPNDNKMSGRISRRLQQHQSPNTKTTKKRMGSASPLTRKSSQRKSASRRHHGHHHGGAIIVDNGAQIGNNKQQRAPRQRQRKDYSHQIDTSRDGRSSPELEMHRKEWEVGFAEKKATFPCYS